MGYHLVICVGFTSLTFDSTIRLKYHFDLGNEKFEWKPTEHSQYWLFIFLKGNLFFICLLFAILNCVLMTYVHICRRTICSMSGLKYVSMYINDDSLLIQSSKGVKYWSNLRFLHRHVPFRPRFANECGSTFLKTRLYLLLG